MRSPANSSISGQFFYLLRNACFAGAEEALANNQAPSLAVFFRGLLPPTAIHAGPQHVCLKRAFAILENRWKMDVAEGSDFLATGGQGPLAFGKYSLSPELFISVFDFLGPHQAMRSGQTCKDWWRNGMFLTRWQCCWRALCLS